ncbi:hypothetical protein [Burkholderia sp. MSMB1588]|uniref:hypothetical protein n=1 Tax=Burkholderia sp. MSMB1588 TaxID=1636423 RepID=UPI0003A1F9D7|nr:hypothetical protein [Burkholderia sp. MSMB1588]
MIDLQKNRAAPVRASMPRSDACEPRAWRHGERRPARRNSRDEALQPLYEQRRAAF